MEPNTNPDQGLPLSEISLDALPVLPQHQNKEEEDFGIMDPPGAKATSLRDQTLSPDLEKIYPPQIPSGVAPRATLRPVTMGGEIRAASGTAPAITIPDTDLTPQPKINMNAMLGEEIAQTLQGSAEARRVTKDVLTEALYKRDVSSLPIPERIEPTFSEDLPVADNTLTSIDRTHDESLEIHTPQNTGEEGFALTQPAVHEPFVDMTPLEGQVHDTRDRAPAIDLGSRNEYYPLGTPTFLKPEKTGRSFSEMMGNMREKLDSKAGLISRGFKNFASRMAREPGETIKNISLEYKNLSFSKKALIACGLIGLSTITGGGAIPLAIGLSLRGLGGIGMYAAYTEKKRKEKGDLATGKEGRIRGALLGMGVMIALPQAFQLAGEQIGSLIYNTFDTNVYHAPEITTPEASSPAPETPAPEPTPETSSPNEGRDFSPPSSPFETASQTFPIQEIPIGRGDSLTSLLANGDHFPELKDLNGYQKTNAIQNVITTISRDPALMAKLGLSENLWLTEGKTFDLAKLHEIITTSKINGESIIERARSL